MSPVAAGGAAGAESPVVGDMTDGSSESTPVVEGYIAVVGGAATGAATAAEAGCC